MDRREQAWAMWAAGDYASWGDLFGSVGAQLVDEVGVGGADVLDVATGTGNTAIAAARSGGRVTGLDITPHLLGIARDRAGAAGLDIKWVEDDMTAMPFPDRSFDRVLSTFGVMLAPDRPAMAAELLRVCRPAGLVAITNWCADAGMSKLGAIVGGFFSPPENPPPRPTDWGDPALVTEFFAGLPATVTTARRTVPVRWASAEEAVSMIAATCGPLIGAVAALRERGDWTRARAAIIDMMKAEATPGSDGLVVQMPYLLTVVGRPDGD
jgi:SAM-dependent methyltransferase